MRDVKYSKRKINLPFAIALYTVHVLSIEHVISKRTFSYIE